MRIRLSLCAWLLFFVAVLAACRQRAVTGSRDDVQTAVTSIDDSARVLMERVDHYYKNVMHDSLAQLAPQALEFNRTHGLWREYYTTWCLLVNDLVWNGQMDKGFEEARKMHQDAVSRNNNFGLSEAYTAMGIAYHFQGEDDEAIDSYRQALRHFPADADQSVKLNIYSYYCQVLADTQNNQLMGEVLTQWKEFLDQLTGGDTENPQNAHKYFRFHRENYKYYLAIRKYRDAASELDQMQLFLNRENDREVYEAQVAGLRTQLAMAQKDYTGAMTWSDREIELSKHQDFNTFLNALKHRSDVLQQLGHYEEALKAWRSYDRQKDSLIKADTREQLNVLNKRFEVDELKAQQERSLLEHEREQLRLVLILAGVVVIGLIVFILLRHRTNHRLREAHALLEQSNHELQQSYEQLKLANERAEESSRMKSNFIKQISHEIRTPLNILSGFTQVITTPDMELEDDEKADIAERITESTNRITGLVNKMLELSEASSQAVISLSDDVMAMEIVAKAIDDAGIAQAIHLSFSLETDDTVAATMLHTNRRQATRALTLLLDNARKFTRPAEAHHRNKHDGEQATACLKLRLADGLLQFIIEDTGIGVPPEEAERIFDEFVQLDEYYDGTGIGLTVARSIARRLGGDIVLDTTYTDGARFVMMLPR